MSITKKLSVSLLAAVVLATGFGSVNQASAAGLSREEAAILAGAGGFIVGTLVGAASERQSHHRRVVYVDSWDAHVARCYARYRTYDEASDTYISNSGYERRCRL
jgi:type IV pilus biogenesis protein CpaD/CtpE